LHRVHHTDRDLDATSGVRFHPVEIAVSLLWKALVILALGPSVLAVIIFEVVLNATAIFTHSNIALPPRLDRAMRRAVVTPDMHRIHHSVIERETNSNFGFNLSIWDRLFRTYRAQAQGPLTLGLSEHQTDRPAGLLFSLLLPFAPSKR
jgi:sterol desaturase/sphingolipid hydroxylase (fatty acid hydroxylase superfamily)